MIIETTTSKDSAKSSQQLMMKDTFLNIDIHTGTSGNQGNRGGK